MSRGRGEAAGAGEGEPIRSFAIGSAPEDPPRLEGSTPSARPIGRLARRGAFAYTLTFSPNGTSYSTTDRRARREGTANEQTPVVHGVVGGYRVRYVVVHGDRPVLARFERGAGFLQNLVRIPAHDGFITDRVAPFRPVFRAFMGLALRAIPGLVEKGSAAPGDIRWRCDLVRGFLAGMVLGDDERVSGKPCRLFSSALTRPLMGRPGGRRLGEPRRVWQRAVPVLESGPGSALVWVGS